MRPLKTPSANDSRGVARLAWRVCARCRGARQRAIGVTLLALGSMGCQSGSDPSAVRIGAKSFTESVVLAEILAAIAREEGASASAIELGGTPVVWNGLLAGEIDAYVEYSGTLREEILQGRQIVDDEDLRSLLRERGLGMTRGLGFNNTYALGISPELSAEHPDVRTISDLAELASNKDLRFGFSHEFMDREDGWPSLCRAYGLPFDSARGLEHALAYRGIQSGSIDVIDVYTTDAQIEHYRVRVLEDDRQYFPDYEAMVLYRLDLRERYPAIVNRFDGLEGSIDAVTMRRLNAEVMLQELPEPRVAGGYLQQSVGSLPATASPVLASRLWLRTREHLQLVGVSVTLAILVAVPLGIAAAKWQRGGQAILGTVGVIQTVPSLVLFVILIPFLGIGPWPAIFALFLYSLLPIVRNTYAGLHDIPGSLQESAQALGLPATARLRLVELPLAARSILAGVKTAAVINVGTATLGGLISAGGYGDPIFTGIRLDRHDLLLEGAIPAAMLALAIQYGFDWLERRLVSPGLRSTIDS
ncbi:MAG: ABC transporter permease subunit [Planctomycetaceae bacterium]|nr:ABC transporter permease subunit [Planctomycetaceae bacterium]